MKWTAALLSTALLTLSACGGGGDGGDADAARANLKADLSENARSMGIVDEKQAGCAADGMVDRLGVDKLKEYGILDENLKVNQNLDELTLSEEDAADTADVLMGCVDAARLITDQIKSSTGGTLTDEQNQCIEDAIDEDALKAMIAAQLQGKDSDAMSGMAGELMKCMMGDLPTG